MSISAFVRTCLLAVSYVGLFVLLGCGGGDQDSSPTEPNEPTVTSVEVSPASAELNAFEATQDFEATATDGDGNTVSGVSFSWSVSPDSVANINSEGTATATANGSATIEASADDVTGSAEMVVRQVVASVQIHRDSALTATFDTTIHLNVTLADSHGNEVSGAIATWSSSDSAVATVDSVGSISFVGTEGAAGVVAESNSIADTVVAVADTGVAFVTLSPDSIRLLTELSTDIQGAVYDIYGNSLSQSISWQSDDSTVATVSKTASRQAQATGKSEGQTSTGVSY